MTKNIPFTNILTETKLAIDAATKAAKAVIEIYDTDFSTSLKDDKEPITLADIKSNKIIEQILSGSGHPILSEESSDELEKRLGSKRVWIVDPLDGTTDFVNKTGEFTIMIALVENNSPILGIISRPSENTLYAAQKNEGSYQFSNKEWKKLHVSKTSELKNCKVVGSRFHQSENERNFLQKLGISNFTSKGSSLKVADISSGKADLYFTTTNKIKQWDTCASNCLVTEAGGIMTDMSGKILKYNTDTVNHQNGILVTNGIIHSSITKLYEKFKKSSK